jgi:hypothetical protein
MTPVSEQSQSSSAFEEAELIISASRKLARKLGSHGRLPESLMMAAFDDNVWRFDPLFVFIRLLI